MQRRTSTLALSALALVTWTAAATAQEPAHTPAAPPALTVTGAGTAEARPDRAVLRVGVVAQAPEAATAQEQAAQALRAGITKLQELGIGADRIQSVGLSLQPVYSDHRPGRDHEPAEPRIVGFRASDTLRVELVEVGRAGDVLDALLQAGLNQVEGIEFLLEDEEPLRRRALRRAAQDAERKAQALADTMDLELVGVLEVTEAGEGGQRPQRLYTARMEAAGTPIEPGRVRVEASVLVSYRVRTPPTEAD